ncbi:50S ribosomal protein L15 [Candidatus Woesebacteria bacterium]|nr:50S ribosomal protein L15 [Candidatus Woesebacteria bacterium]
MIQLPKLVKKRSKRVGRGYGSGKGGHTVGRGQKGQKARGKIGILFEGVKVKKSLLRRLPLQRGKSKFKPSDKPIVMKISLLNLFDNGDTVDIKTLIQENLVMEDDAKKYGVKILGDGELKKKLTIAVPISKSAARKVEEAGGKVVK